ncbi:hypothetical protein BC827DRAFT_1268006 [Russula dissimulans]|nr:hypothetical protein BC827DRAFT_1268006 [Russula dissimulans]
MYEEEDVLRYHRQFLLLSKPLYNNRSITPQQCNALFWRGFHPNDRAAMLSCLIAKHPEQPCRQAFDLKEVLKIALAIFTGDEPLMAEEQWEVSHSINTPDRLLHSYDDGHVSYNYSLMDDLDPLHNEEPHQRAQAETWTVHFKEQTRKDEDRELDNLDKSHLLASEFIPPFDPH